MKINKNFEQAKAEMLKKLQHWADFSKTEIIYEKKENIEVWIVHMNGYDLSIKAFEDNEGTLYLTYKCATTENVTFHFKGKRGLGHLNY